MKNVSDRRKLKKKSATESCELAIKSATGSTWKKSATGATWKRNQRQTCAGCQKKVSDRHILGKISDGRKLGITSNVRNLKRKSARDSCDTEKKTCDMLNLGKSQRLARPGKKSAMRATWIKKTTGATCEKGQRPAQDEKKVSDGLMRAGNKVSDGFNLEEISNKRNLKKKPATHLCGCQKKVSDRHILGKISDGRKLGITSHVRNLKRKSARDSCDTEKQICDMRNLGKNQGRARPGKKPAMRATWIKKKQRARPVKNVSDRRKLKKKSATESCELAIKSATGSTWKKTATGATWKRN